MVFREYLDIPGHSSFVNKAPKTDLNKYIEYKVPIKPLSEIFKENKIKKIDFLKIDVEGYEYEVIAGNDWNLFQPKVICIEANKVDNDWRPLLTCNNYRLLVKDGLNEYYISKKFWGITYNFAENVVKLNHHSLRPHQAEQWLADSKELVIMKDLSIKLQKHITSLDKKILDLKDVSTLSLKRQTFIKRLKRAIYGLTIDWLEYKKSKVTKNLI